MEEQTYYVDVTVKFTEVVMATSKQKAIQTVKNSFLEGFNIELTDKEITKVTKEC